ncbi:30S ribosomal protein S20 [bacterium]|nr:30S ribosomal protein S20 [bacterium]MBU1065867.1 30S ribosomal protein S20 [bacterium]MBU1634190.1 30S ribosomal protein S20 [bacterium]MBU1872809.1 30S ribosomal protein S20 [bacterium]
MSKNLSVQKRIRQADKARLRNKHYKTLMKSMIKKVKTAGSKEEAEPLYREAASIIDSIVGKGIIHRNNAANKKSKLAAHIAKLS